MRALICSGCQGDVAGLQMSSLRMAVCTCNADLSYVQCGSSTSRGFHGLSRGFGVLRSPYGAHRHKSCWDDLSHGPACRCSNFFVGNFVAAPDIAQNPAAPPRSLFARYPALRTPAALRRRPRHAHRRFRAAQLVVVTVYAHAPAPRRTRTKVAGRKTADGARNLGEKERALFNARDRFT